jgi:hypothetical protein
VPCEKIAKFAIFLLKNRLRLYPLKEILIAPHHPSKFIQAELVQIIRDTAVESEQLTQLHPLQLAIIHDQKWFQLFVPEIYHGLELSLPKALKLEEALAWTDGSLGWTVTLCAGAAWFIGFLDPEIVSDIFNNDAFCIAGSGKPSGIAKDLSDGYEISGYWDYATGASQATAFTANCMIEADDVLLKNEDGTPQIKSFLFLRDEVTVHKNWHSMGMIATGSHSFEVRKLRVKNDRSFHIDVLHSTLPHSIYQYPFLPFAETTIAINSSGMAVRFLDLCEKSLPGPVDDCRKILDQGRLVFYEVVENSWTDCLNHQIFPNTTLNHITRVSKDLARISRQVVNELYPYCGMKAADPGTELNRVWRNLYTASQHSLLLT